jgi:serine/threonine protein phosphatase PrpC
MTEAFGVSDPGSVRPNNEDSFLTDEALSLFVVADGMGGHAAGEVASRLAVEAIENFIRRSQQPGDVSWPCGIDPDLSYTGNRLRTAIYLANRRVFRAAEGHDDYTGMGTTVVCALLTAGRLTIGHVGDSRLYLLCDGTLTPQTRDDTWAATVLAGTVDPDRISEHPMRNVLTNVLGAREQTEIHLTEHALRGGELLLLCSDGVHSVLDDDSLHTLLSPDRSLEQMARAIVTTAIERGSRDNVTALVVRYSDESHGR